MIMIRDIGNMFQQMSGMPINSKNGKALLRKYGINTNSAQYKAAMKQMSEASHGGVGYTNPQAIRMGILSMHAVWQAWMLQGSRSLSGIRSSAFPRSQDRICLMRQNGISWRKMA